MSCSVCVMQGRVVHDEPAGQDQGLGACNNTCEDSEAQVRYIILCGALIRLANGNFYFIGLGVFTLIIMYIMPWDGTPCDTIWYIILLECVYFIG